jgi:hypothetical protein
MLGKLSQIGKNLSEEWENAVNAGRGAGPAAGRKSTEVLSVPQKMELLSAKTPEPSTLEVCGDETKKDQQESEEMKEKTESQADNENAVNTPTANTGIDAVADGLPAEVQKKLRKFDRYEAKYPCTCEGML